MDEEVSKVQAERMKPGLNLDEFSLVFQGLPSLNLLVLPDSPKFTIVAVTDAYLAATLTERDVIMGKGLFEVFPDNPEDPHATGTANLRASLDRALRDKQPDSMAVQRYDVATPSGKFVERFWSPINTPIMDEDENVCFLLHRVEEVTEYMRLKNEGAERAKLTQELQHRAHQMESEIYLRAQDLQATNERLRVANEKLGRLDELKTEFFSNVSHEFRTPLTLLIGPLEDLLNDDAHLNSDQREQLALSHRNALRLMKLVNTLLDFSRLEAGRMRARFVPTNIAKFTVELASVFRSAAAKSGVKLKIDCPPLSQPVFVDRDMYEKIVLNLISNSLKHTVTGSITVRVEEDDGMAKLTVRDTGTGIPADELDQIFERFHRVKGQQARIQEGTGIGLSLVKELCSLHKGEISATSTLGEGTEMTVKVPFGHEHLPSDQVEFEEPELDPIQRADYVHEAKRWLETDTSPRVIGQDGAEDAPNILLVDDSEDMRNYISRLLIQSGYPWRITVAEDGLEALETARKSPPSLILSDIMMPRMTGLELVEAIRKDAELQRVPIILLSARAGEEATIEGLEHGADDYLVKPFSGLELITRVKTHLALSQNREDLLGQLNAKNRMLDAMNGELEAFSYSVAHDLRAPLRAMSGFAGIIRDDFAEELGAEGIGHLDRITASAARMSQLIEDLLDLSRINRGNLTISEVDLTEIASRIAENLRESAPERRAKFDIEPALRVQADGRLLQIALENLLGNAWKFTRNTEEAVIRFGKVRENGEIVFFVEDNGDGFDMQYATNLFRPFHRLHSNSEFEGTGIGLATVQRIVNRHGGEISAEGLKGIGATFTFSIRKPH